MKLLLCVVTLMLAYGNAAAQHPQMRSGNRTIGTSYDAMAIDVPEGKTVKIDISNKSSTDTLKYCFVARQADTTSATVYLLTPLQSKRVELTVPGIRFLMRKATGGTVFSQAEQIP